MLIISVILLLLAGLSVYLFGLLWDIKGTGFISMFLWFIAGLLAMEVEIENEPQAIDVYRGETTLEITYRDNIPIDSVVVFKNE